VETAFRTERADVHDRVVRYRVAPTR
jgi:hypothetical protein